MWHFEKLYQELEFPSSRNIHTKVCSFKKRILLSCCSARNASQTSNCKSFKLRDPTAYSASPLQCLKGPQSLQNPPPTSQLLYPAPSKVPSSPKKYILSVAGLKFLQSFVSLNLLSYPMSNPLQAAVPHFACKRHLDTDHISQPSLVPHWSKAPSSFAWISAMADQLVSCFHCCSCPPLFTTQQPV